MSRETRRKLDEMSRDLGLPRGGGGRGNCHVEVPQGPKSLTQSNT